MNGLDHDEEFRNLLRQLSELDRSEPSPELDRIIIERARHAIRPPRDRLPLFQRRWAMPAGLAATAVIATALVLFSAIPRAPGDHSMPEARSMPAHTSAAKTAEVPAAPPAMNTGPAMTSDVAPAGVIARPEHDAPAKDRSLIPVPEEAATAVAADSPSPAMAASGSTSASAPASTQEKAQRIAPASLREAPATDAGNRSFANDPAKWLAEIHRLRAAGKIAAADREWVAFRNAWPDYPVEDSVPER